MEGLWQKLQDEVSSFNCSTEEKRRIYNDLLTKDKRGVAEVADNNKKIQKLLEDMAKLKEALTELGLDEDKRLSGLRAERDELTKELHATRRAVSVDYRNREEMGLRKLAAQTDQVEKVGFISAPFKVYPFQQAFYSLCSTILVLGPSVSSPRANDADFRELHQVRDGGGRHGGVSHRHLRRCHGR